ncbi:hypothetical protein V8C35DRAFT_9892 [Trichoderma chlorosporum]
MAFGRFQITWLIGHVVFSRGWWRTTWAKNKKRNERLCDLHQMLVAPTPRARAVVSLPSHTLRLGSFSLLLARRGLDFVQFAYGLHFRLARGHSRPAKWISAGICIVLLLSCHAALCGTSRCHAQRQDIGQSATYVRLKLTEYEHDNLPR